MKHAAAFLAVSLLAGAAAAQTVPPAALAEAGRTARLEAIDYGEKFCDADLRVEDWLKQLTGKDAKRIVWSGGACQIVGIGPGIDAQSHPWCAHAEIQLSRPRKRDDVPIIEVFLERPRQGKPGPAYAFRGIMMTVDGPDMIRFRRDFASAWRERFPKPAGTKDCHDDE